MNQSPANALDSVIIVLVEPQKAENIGGVVRAMMNMGLRRLRLVNPADYRPERIEVAAHRSQTFRQGIEMFDDLGAALSDVNLIVAASSRARRLGPRLGAPRDLAPTILDHAGAGAPAILFGREDWGLPNEVVDQAHFQLVIPTDPTYASLNLAQAVLLVCYELRQASIALDAPPPASLDPSDPPATEAEFAAATAALHGALQAAGFYKPTQEPAKRLKLDRLLRRAQPTSSEAGLIRAMGHVLAKKINRINNTAQST